MVTAVIGQRWSRGYLNGSTDMMNINELGWPTGMSQKPGLSQQHQNETRKAARHKPHQQHITHTTTEKRKTDLTEYQNNTA